MSKRFRVWAIVIAVITLSASTFCGVFAANKLSNITFTNNVTQYLSLDNVDEDVGMVNVLFLGVDDGGYRSDTIMLASLDGYSSRVSILSIPRDTMVKINGSTQKINATMGIAAATSTATPSPKTLKEEDGEAEPQETGDTPNNNEDNAQPKDNDDTNSSKLSNTPGYEDALINEIKSITGLPIHYFVTVDFDGFMDVIEAVDGVEFDVPYDMDYDDPVQGLHIHLKAGQQHLTGQLAHDFVRFRHNNDGSAPGEYVMGDEGRMYWQQQFVKELIRQKLTPQYLAKVSDVFDVVKDNVRTNLTLPDVMKNLNALKKVKPEDIISYQLPGEFEYINSLWYFVYDPDETQELIDNVFRPQSREEWESYLAEQAENALPEPSASDEKSDE